MYKVGKLPLHLRRQIEKVDNLVTPPVLTRCAKELHHRLNWASPRFLSHIVVVSLGESKADGWELDRGVVGVWSGAGDDQ